MTPPRALSILVAEQAYARVHAALMLACSAAALGRPVHIFFGGRSVQALLAGARSPEDAEFAAAGVPTVPELLASAGELGVDLTACQSGLALSGARAAELRHDAEAGGLIAFLAADPHAEIVAF